MRFGKTLIAAAAMLGAAFGPAQAADYAQLHRGLGIPANNQLADYTKTDGVKVLVELVPEVKSTMSIFGRTASVVEQLGLEGVEDLIQFKRLDEERRRAALNELASEAEKLGLGY